MTIVADPLRGNAHLVDALGSALRSGEHGLSTVPALLKRVLVEESWREFVTQRGEHVRHDRFIDFAAAKPLRGIGATPRLIEKVIDAIEDPAERAQVRDLYDRAMQGRQGERSDLVDNVNEVDRPTGNRADQALRKLRKDAPDLHAEVLAGTISAHAAMVRAGFRPRTFTIKPEPTSAARTIRRYMTAEQVAELVRCLTDGGDTDG